MTWPLRVLFVLLALAPAMASALEVEPFVASLSHQRIDGCCQSTGTRSGIGARIRMDLDERGLWDVVGYSDRRWSEFSIMRRSYLTGGPAALDPSGDAAIQVQRVKHWNTFWSYGAGFFSHSTRTIQFDLPAAASGFSINGEAGLGYVLNDHWSVSSAFRLGLAVGADDRGIVHSLSFGLGYRP